MASMPDPIPEGKRNDTLFRHACGLRSQGLEADSILDALRAMNKKRCRPPLTDDELHRITSSAMRYEPGAKIPATDLGNARRLVDRHGPDLLHCAGWGYWLIWDGTRWQRDVDGEVMRRATDTVYAMLEEARSAGGETSLDLARFAMKSQAGPRLREMVGLAQSFPGIACRTEEFDRHHFLLPCANGTLDLRTGELLEPNRDHRITRRSPIPYDPYSPAPRWHAFLDEIFEGNQALIRFVQRAAGYSLTGDTGEGKLFFCYGPGRNGKSVFIGAVEHVLGEYARPTRPETLLARDRPEIPNDIAALVGRRFVATTEVAEGKRIAEELVKQLTGGDTMTARFMRAEYFDFVPTFKLWMSANHQPKVNGADAAIWARILVVPFLVTIPEEKQDRKLLKKLKAEAPGILAWLVEGCLAWQREGLKPPAAVRAATDTYKEEMDTLGRFIEDCCVLHPNAVTPAGPLYGAYRIWCQENGEREQTQTNFGRKLTGRGLSKDRTSAGDRIWHGVGLRAGSDGFDAFDAFSPLSATEQKPKSNTENTSNASNASKGGGDDRSPGGPPDAPPGGDVEWFG